MLTTLAFVSGQLLRGLSTATEESAPGDRAQVHHGDAIGEVADDAQIVGNEQIRPNPSSVRSSARRLTMVSSEGACAAYYRYSRLNTPQVPAKVASVR